MTDYAVVVPTVGRPSLTRLLESLAAAGEPLPRTVVVVDDRTAGPPLPPAPPALAPLVTVRRSGGRGPAAARNVGWRAVAGDCTWVVFLDDDVEVGRHWCAALARDLAQPEDVAGVQGRILVPLPPGRRPTDWERGTAGLMTASWITADMAYRRAALEQVGGFDERFPRAYREDADLALRVQGTGARLVRGARRTTHPVRPADRWASVRQQAGNADDPLMRRLHGAGWRTAAAAPPGRRRAHVATTLAAAVAVGAVAARRHLLAASAAGAWAASTAWFAGARIAPGPRTADEVGTMLATSVAIPPAATWHWLRGEWRHRHAGPWDPRPPVRAVLFDRDGTLVHDVPYNGDPAAVRPVDGARSVLDDLRHRGIRTGLVSNQSGVARGLLTMSAVRAVNARLQELLGRFDAVEVCPHDPAAGCGCRKPAPGLVLAAARTMGVAPREVAVIGDIGSDVEAAAAAGARAVLVPTPVTRPQEVAAAELVAGDLAEAVRLVTGGPS